MDTILLSRPHSNAPSFTSSTRKDQLNEAFQAELSSPERALKIYLSLAKQGDGMAQALYIMLILKSLGDPCEHELSMGIKIKTKKENGEEIETVKKVIDSRIRELSNIVFDFNQYHPPETAVAQIPLEFQYILLKIIIDNKKGTDTEKLTVTCSDIVNLIDKLIAIFAEMDSPCKNILEEYKTCDLALLLASGLSYYNQKNKKSVVIVTREYELPSELWNSLSEYLPMRSHINLGCTSKVPLNHTTSWKSGLNEEGAAQATSTDLAKNNFLQYLDLSKTKYIECYRTGRLFLDQIGLTDPMLLNKVENGELSLIEIVERYTALNASLKEERASYLPAVPCIYSDNYLETLFKNPWVHARIVDGTLTEETLLDSFTDPGRKAMAIPWVQACFNNGLMTFKRLEHLSHDGLRELEDLDYQRNFVKKADSSVKDRILFEQISQLVEQEKESEAFHVFLSFVASDDFIEEHHISFLRNMTGSILRRQLEHCVNKPVNPELVAAVNYLWGMVYYFGQGVEKDYKKAVEYFQQAARSGSTAAETSLGFMYLYGHGTEQNYLLAKVCLKRAAKAGNSTALNHLGDMYREGRGVKINYERAKKYYGLSASAGNLTGRCYFDKLSTFMQHSRPAALAQKTMPQ